MEDEESHPENHSKNDQSLKEVNKCSAGKELVLEEVEDSIAKCKLEDSLKEKPLVERVVRRAGVLISTGSDNPESD